MRTEILPVVARRTVRIGRTGELKTVPHDGAAEMRFPSGSEFPVAAEIEIGARREVYRRLSADGLLYRPARMRGRTRDSRPAQALFDDDCILLPEAEVFAGGLVPGQGDETFPASHVPFALRGSIEARHWLNPFVPDPYVSPPRGRPAAAEGPAEADARIARIASRMLVFGESLWLAAREPIWTASNGSVTLASADWSGEGRGHRLDRLEAAGDEARGLHAGGIRVHGSVLFVDPALLRYDETMALARFIAVHVIRNDAALMRLLPEDAVDLFLEVRRLANGTWPADAAGAARLVAAARTYAAAFGRIGLNDLGRKAGVPPAEALARAFARWDLIAGDVMAPEDEDAMTELGGL